MCLAALKLSHKKTLCVCVYARLCVSVWVILYDHVWVGAQISQGYLTSQAAEGRRCKDMLRGKVSFLLQAGRQAHTHTHWVCFLTVCNTVQWERAKREHISVSGNNTPKHLVYADLLQFIISIKRYRCTHMMMTTSLIVWLQAQDRWPAPLERPMEGFITGNRNYSNKQTNLNTIFGKVGSLQTRLKCEWYIYVEVNNRCKGRGRAGCIGKGWKKSFVERSGRMKFNEKAGVNGTKRRTKKDEEGQWRYFDIREQCLAVCKCKISMGGNNVALW